MLVVESISIVGLHVYSMQLLLFRIQMMFESDLVS